MKIGTNRKKETKSATTEDKSAKKDLKESHVRTKATASNSHLISMNSTVPTSKIIESQQQLAT